MFIIVSLFILLLQTDERLRRKSTESILLVVVITNIISLTEYVDSITAGAFLIT